MNPVDRTDDDRIEVARESLQRIERGEAAPADYAAIEIALDAFSAEREAKARVVAELRRRSLEFSRDESLCGLGMSGAYRLAAALVERGTP